MLPVTTPPKLSALAAAGLGLLVAAPVVTWWVVGDQSEVTDPDYADYLVRPPNISSTVEAISGLIALALVVGVLVAAFPRLRDQREWRAPFAAVLAAGAMLGFAGRLCTAGVSGANIGAGLMMLIGGPAYVALIAFAATRTHRLRRQRDATP